MNRVNQMYQEALRLKREKVKKIGFIIIPILFIVSSIMFTIYLSNSDDTLFVLVLVSVSTGFLALLGVLLIYYIIDDKAMYNILFTEIIRDMNLNEQRNLDYTPFIKEKELFNDSGLYPKGTSKNTKFKLSLNTDDHTNVQIFLTEIFTQTNNSRVVYFKGLYFVFETFNQDIFQIRKKGKERHKSVKLVKEELLDKTKIFTEGKQISNQYLSLYNELEKQYGKVDISGIKNQIHIAIHNYLKIKNEKVITDDVYKKYYDMILSIVQLTDQISSKMAY